MTIAEQMITELQAEAAMTRKLLARIPADKLSFTPGYKIQTIGWNAAHLAEIVGWAAGIITDPGMDLAKFDPSMSPPLPTAIEPLLKHFDDNLAKSLALLATTTDAKMQETWTMRHGDQVYFVMKKDDCIRKWVFTHTAHHRGILSATLRLAGVEHGSIYEE